ncbi:gamma-glutamylcyclotransferase family protein [Pseudomonas fluorescens]|uniref:gamma-glutamylcyclotransferase family protein n=1 Tax=Pseudomonas fluorescens TaxID=294 RepID=UPI003D215398
MTDSGNTQVYLFSYGTLQDKAVQLANFGRELSGSADQMLGYEQSWVEITDPEVLATSGKTHHPILRPGGADSVPITGMVFRITPAELAAADSYEVSDYKRVSVVLASGIEAWVYVSA